MLRAAAALLVVAALGLAGCLGTPQAAQPNALPPLSGLLPAAEPLWVNPQTAPHPAFNYPTLTNLPSGPGVPAWWRAIPAAALPSPITGFEPLASAGDQAASGAGMSLFGGLAVVPGFGNPTAIFDIRDPAAPKLLSTIDESHRNVDFIAYPSGRLVAIFSTSEGILPYWDISDPAAPVRLGELKPTSGTHKVNVVPGTPIVYNANSNGGGCIVEDPTGGLACFLVPVGQPRTPALGSGITEIFDLTDPMNPVHVQDWANGFGCHHIYFWNSPAEGKFRALCAGIEMTQIWDTVDPRNPVLVVNVPMQHGNKDVPSTSLGLESFSHFSILNAAGDVLVVGDESGGGGFPPGCVAGAQTPARDVSTPVGALWFYDVSDEANPRLLGWYSPGLSAVSNPPEPGVEGAFYSCTAHHGRLVPDPDGRDLLAMAFYRAGVVLLDFSDPSAPRMLHQWNDGANTWEVQYYNGYLFTGDLARGMDVFTFV